MVLEVGAGDGAGDGLYGGTCRKMLFRSSSVNSY